MLYVYITDRCYEDAKRINTLDDIESLKDKLIHEQSTRGLERHPWPFLKKRKGRTRIILAEVFDGDDVILCFLRHVYKVEIGEYETFFKTLEVPRTDQLEFSTFLMDARSKPIQVKNPLTSLETEYLVLDRQQEMGQLTVLESPIWISVMRTFTETAGKKGLITPIWELLESVCEKAQSGELNDFENRHKRYSVSILFRYFHETNYLFLVAPIEHTDQKDAQSVAECRRLLDRSANFKETDLLRHAARAYPDFILYDREIWESTQASIDANLALSPEEGEVLAGVLDPGKPGGFPLFINGRPGSGKSTILQYLFAEYLHTHLARPNEKRLPYPPLYLTYNERLLENARHLVSNIFKCGARKLAATETVNLARQEYRDEFNRAFKYFRAFLLSLVGRDAFPEDKYVDFHTFRSLYVTLLQGPDAKLRRLAPEVAWHTIRTYIKGKSSGGSDYFEPDSYAELPRDEITVTPETYELVWDKVWNGWYRIQCEKDGYWDDQDLARRILDDDLVQPEYPGVFCDEAQDFTAVELELIFRLSRYSTKQIEPFYLSRIPYVFAGDPFQTLNPTGFRWDAIKANFHDNIVRQLDPAQRWRIEFTFRELAYNYRSTTNIVRFCNLIQLKRAELFQIPDITPQKAWAIDEGAWPAYFELDLGTQGKLKDQGELVIVVPCQEGEETSFVEKDDYLRTIALDNKGGVTRNILSPMRAKGLEFGRVVLYKFGEQAVRDGFVSTISKIDENKTSHMGREQTLGLEYFFNGVYVGASRAQRRLLVVDTPAGLVQFWSFAKDGHAITRLLTERRRTVWDEDDVHHMMPGDPSTWSEDRDDPKAVADRFYDQGRIERSTYLLQLARNQYQSETLKDVGRAERCTALIHDIDGDYISAAASYEQLNEIGDAIRCYWEAKEHGKVLEVAAKNPGKFGMYPFVVGSRFAGNQMTVESAQNFLRNLADTQEEQRLKQLKANNWPQVVQQAVSVLAGDTKKDAPICCDEAKEMFRLLNRLQSESGLALDKSIQLARLAFLADDASIALDVWKEVQWRAGQREPDFILRARALTTQYPQRLRWYGLLFDHRTIVEEYQAHASERLDDEYLGVVLKALFDQQAYALAVDLVRVNASWKLMRQTLVAIPNSKLGQQAAQSMLGYYLEKGLEKGEFRQVIEDIKPDKTTISVFVSLLSDEKILLGTEAALIKILARSRVLVEERADDNFISGSILTFIKKRGEKLKELLTPEEVGSALERAGRIDNALSFYETVYRDKKWGKNRGTEYNAKERWLRCKVRQAEFDQKNERRKNERLAEAKRRSAEWGLPVPDAQYVELRVLAPYEVDTLVGAYVPRSETSEPGSLQETSEQQKPETTSPAEPAEAMAIGGNEDDASVEDKPAPVASKPDFMGDSSLTAHDGASPSVTGVQQFLWPLPTRPPFCGRISLTYKHGSRSLMAFFLPQKRRLELRDEANEDLVMIKAGDGNIESPDVVVAELSIGQWSIDAWSLNISLEVISPDVTLVDLSDQGGERILCLVA